MEVTTIVWYTYYIYVREYKVYVCDACMHGMYRGRSNYSPPSSDHQPHTHQIHQRDARMKKNKSSRNIITLTFWKRNEWSKVFLSLHTLLQAIENSLFIHAFSAVQCLVKPPAMYHLQIVAPLMPPACTAEHLMPPLHPSWCSCGDFKEFRGNVRLCFRPPTVALNECHRVAAAPDIWTFCGRGHYSSDNLCRR